MLRRNIHHPSLIHSFKRIKLYFGLYVAFYFHLRILIAKEIYKRLVEQKYITDKGQLL